MSAEPLLTSDVIGLTKVAPFSRRGFMTASAAVAAGYTLAAGPVRADVIKTDTTGITTGDAKIKVADGEMPGYFARPAGVSMAPKSRPSPATVQLYGRPSTKLLSSLVR